MEGTRLRLKVAPGARRSGIVGRHGEGWKVRVAAQPEGGRANDAVVTLLADTLTLSRRAVRLVSGHGARDKIVELSGIDASNVDRRLDAASKESA